MAESQRSDRLLDVHPQMLRASSALDPQRLGELNRREVGQAFEWALDEAHVTKQDAAFRMGYTDSGVIGRWISGIENIQLPKVKLLADVYPLFLLALLQPLPGVQTQTQVTFNRTRGGWSGEERRRA